MVIPIVQMRDNEPIRNFASIIISRVHIRVRWLPFDEMTIKFYDLYFVEIQAFNKVIISTEVVEMTNLGSLVKVRTGIRENVEGEHRLFDKKCFAWKQGPPPVFAI